MITVLYLYMQGALESGALRLGVFQAVSIGTTTGFTTSDYAQWPSFLPVFLLSASFIGGCAGSTGGGHTEQAGSGPGQCQCQLCRTRPLRQARAVCGHAARTSGNIHFAGGAHPGFLEALTSCNYGL